MLMYIKIDFNSSSILSSKMFGIILLTLFLLSSAEEAEDLRAPSKPFGVGIGPVYIGGQDTDLERAELTLKIYKQYINYKRLSQQSLREDEEYYAR